MTSFREVYAALRRKNFKNYLLLIGCCYRVVILRDGVVYRTLQNHGNREQFQDELLDVIREMGKE